MTIPVIAVKELKTLRDEKRPHFLLDVREPEEHEICRIEGATLIPLNQLTQRVGELPKGSEIIVHCHHGGRSAQAVAFLIQQGYSAKNLSGGIDAWSEQIDADVPRY